MSHHEQLTRAGFRLNEYAETYYHAESRIIVAPHEFEGVERFDAICHDSQRYGRAETLRGALHSLISEIRGCRDAHLHRNKVKRLRAVIDKIEQAP